MNKIDLYNHLYDSDYLIREIVQQINQAWHEEIAYDVLDTSVNLCDERIDRLIDDLSPEQLIPWFVGVCDMLDVQLDVLPIDYESIGALMSDEPWPVLEHMLQTLNPNIESQLAHNVMQEHVWQAWDISTDNKPYPTLVAGPTYAALDLNSNVSWTFDDCRNRNFALYSKERKLYDYITGDLGILEPIPVDKIMRLTGQPSLF